MLYEFLKLKQGVLLIFIDIYHFFLHFNQERKSKVMRIQCSAAYFSSAACTLFLSSGTTSSSNQGFFFSQILFSGLG